MEKRLKILVPIVFWLILLSISLIRTLPFITNDEQLFRFLKVTLITSLLDLLTFLLFYLWLIPGIIKNKNLYFYVSFIIIFVGAYSFVWGGVYWATGMVDSRESFFLIYKSSLGHTLLYAVLGAVVYLSLDWFFKFKKQKELENYNREMELAILRSQINPHFLFNTLNNINSFVYDEPDKTSYSIIKLSEIMRYMLYETKTDSVFLDKEIQYITNYLELQKLRLQKKEYINFMITGDSAGKKIAPMLFIPFIENAFKHGKKNIEKGIVISLSITDEQIDFFCENYIRKLNKTELLNEGGVGLENIKRRLELLYPDNHELKIEKDKHKFKVHLTVKIVKK